MVAITSKNVLKTPFNPKTLDIKRNVILTGVLCSDNPETEAENNIKPISLIFNLEPSVFKNILGSIVNGSSSIEVGQKEIESFIIKEALTDGNTYKVIASNAEKVEPKNYMLGDASKQDFLYIVYMYEAYKHKIDQILTKNIEIYPTQLKKENKELLMDIYNDDSLIVKEAFDHYINFLNSIYNDQDKDIYSCMDEYVLALEPEIATEVFTFLSERYKEIKNG